MNSEPLLDPNGLEVPERAVYLVFLIIFVDTLAGSISTPVMPYYAKSLHIKKENIGWLYGAWSLTSTVFAPCLSRAADSLGRRPVLILSLFGAGLANLIQGVAPSFAVFLFGRFFSGIWAAVGATCNVYVTDVTSESVRPKYLGRLAMVPAIAMLFGPGIGGGLSELSPNVPILADACLTLFFACVVSYYLPETPAFMRQKQLDDAPAKGGSSSGPVKVPLAVHFLGIASFMAGISFSTMVSQFALFMEYQHNFNALKTGFCFMGSSIVMMMSSVWFVPCLSKRMSQVQLSALGSVINAFGYVGFSSAHDLSACLGFFAVFAFGNACKMASGSAVTAEFTTTSNRGKIFGIVQIYTNCGRMVGPVLASYSTTATAMADSLSVSADAMPFVVAACISLCSALTLLVAVGGRSQRAPEEKLARTTTTFGADWKDESGTKQEIEELGRYVANILTQRHYKWVSKKEEVFKLLDVVLPELDTAHREAYDESLRVVGIANTTSGRNFGN